jgi:hypothetical protein
MAATPEHKARPTRIMEASVAKVMISQPAHMGIHIDIMVRLRPNVEHIGEDKGALNMATRGTMLLIQFL